jgi:hypothetical protein
MVIKLYGTNRYILVDRRADMFTLLVSLFRVDSKWF